MGDISPQRQGPTYWGDWESCLGGGYCPRSAYSGIAAPNGTGPPLAGTGSPAHAWSLPKERLRGKTANGTGPPAEGTGSPAEAVAVA